ncbi:MAG: biotin transporter BioY [Deltaproteobacteria bacterium]|nr:biotin transporter BioY [Deltaproteobacteria bacterium]
MATTHTAAPTLSIKTNAASWIKTIALAACGALVLTLCAKITVPFYPVPMTFQTFGVLLIGAAFGLRLGMGTILVYLAEGAVGLPVFAGTPARGIGLPYMLGPTGGYLLGFIFATVIVGYFADRGWNRHLVKIGLAMAIANVALYIPGLLWLAQFTGWERVLPVGFYPFVLADPLKWALAAAVALPAGSLVRKLRG